MNIIASTLRLAEVGQSWAVGMYVATALHMYLCHSCGLTVRLFQQDKARPHAARAVQAFQA